MKNSKKLYLSRDDKIISGLCGGLGEYFTVDSNVFRIIFLLLGILGGSGIVIYFLCFLLIPSCDVIASENKKRKKDKEIVCNHNHKSGIFQIFFGFLIVFFGLNWLFEEILLFNPLHFINWDVVFSIFIIIFGFNIILKDKN